MANPSKGKTDRNDDPKQMVRTGPAAPLAQDGSPAWLADYAGKDDPGMMEAMREYRLLPRLKMIQGLTRTELKSKFGEGAVVLAPGDVLVVKPNEVIHFVPVFFFAEFCLWADRKDTTSNAILERSLDKRGNIAIRARDQNRRFEPYGEMDPKTKAPKFQKRYVEHLNFPGFIYQEGHPLSGVPVTLTFSRGEFGKGRAFVNAIMLRKIGNANAPLWATVWALTPGFRDRGQNKWWGIDFENPTTVDPYIKQAEIPFFQGMHADLKALYERNAIGVAQDVDPDEEPEAPDVDL